MTPRRRCFAPGIGASSRPAATLLLARRRRLAGDGGGLPSVALLSGDGGGCGWPGCGIAPRRDARCSSESAVDVGGRRQLALVGRGLARVSARSRWRTKAASRLARSGAPAAALCLARRRHTSGGDSSPRPPAAPAATLLLAGRPPAAQPAFAPPAPAGPAARWQHFPSQDALRRWRLARPQPRPRHGPMPNLRLPCCLWDLYHKRQCCAIM